MTQIKWPPTNPGRFIGILHRGLAHDLRPAATSEQTRELRTDALDQIARGITPSIPISPPTPHSNAIDRIEARFSGTTYSSGLMDRRLCARARQFEARHAGHQGNFTVRELRDDELQELSGGSNEVSLQRP